MSYQPQHDLSRAARHSSDPRRLLAGVILTVFVFLGLSWIYSNAIGILAPASAWGPDGLGVEQATTPWGVLINLFVFGMLIIALWLAVLLVHDRSLRSLLGPIRLAWRQFLHVLAVLLVLHAGLALLPAPDAMVPVPNLEAAIWLRFLPLALLGLVVQVSAEELAFRGYLQSQLAARYRHPAVWLGLPTALFAALHYTPAQSGENAWIIVIWAGFFGLAAADLTARSGTLGPAIALHLVNNAAAILLVAPMGGFDGLALYSYPFFIDATETLRLWMPIDLMLLLCSWLAARLALRR